MARSAVGSVADRKVSNVFAVEPSKLKLPVVPISKLPVTVPPASGSFSVSNSSIAACTLLEARLPKGVNDTWFAVTVVKVCEISISVHYVPLDKIISGGFNAA